MVAALFKFLLLLSCLSMFVLKREYKPAVFIFCYTLLSEVSLPLPMGNTVYFLPMFFILTEGLQIKQMIHAFRIRELVSALLVFVVTFLYTYADSPHYWGSIKQFVTLLFRECITTYFILIVGFYSLKNVNTFRPFLKVSFWSLCLLTFFGVINVITKQSTILDLVTGGVLKQEVAVGRMFTDNIRFRAQSLFIQPFDYGYTCLILMLVQVYGYTRGLAKKRTMVLAVAMCLFGAVACECRTILFSLIIGFLAYSSLYLKGSKVPIYVVVFIILAVSLYHFSPFIQEKTDFIVSVFNDEENDVGGSSLGIRLIQFDRVLSYLRGGHFLTGRGYDYFWIDLQYYKGQEYSLDPQLYGLEGVHLKYLLERGIVGYVLYLLFYILLISYLWRHRHSNREEASAALALLAVYMSFAHMTGELKSLPPTLLLLGMYLRLIQEESWKYVRYQRKVFNARYRHRKLSRLRSHGKVHPGGTLPNHNSVPAGDCR